MILLREKKGDRLLFKDSSKILEYFFYLMKKKIKQKFECRMWLNIPFQLYYLFKLTPKTFSTKN